MKGIPTGASVALAAWTVIAIALIPRTGPSDRVPLVWTTGRNPEREAQIARFHEMHPHLFLRADADNTGVMKVVVQSSAGMGPDLIDHITPVTAQTYIEAGILWDVTEQAKALGFGPETLHEAVRPLVLLRDWETMEYRQYFYPCNVAHHFVLYNKDHVEEAGLPDPQEDLTWDDYIRLARSLTRYAPDRRTVPEVFGAAGVDPHLCIWSHGGDMLNREGTRSRLAEPEAVAGMRFYHDLGSYRALLWPLIMIKDEHLHNVPLGMLTFQGQYGTQIELLLAATVICIIPLIVLFVFLQKQLVRGIHLGGGVKG